MSKMAPAHTEDTQPNESRIQPKGRSTVPIVRSSQFRFGKRGVTRPATLGRPWESKSPAPRYASSPHESQRGKGGPSLLAAHQHGERHRNYTKETGGATQFVYRGDSYRPNAPERYFNTARPRLPEVSQKLLELVANTNLIKAA